MIKLLQFLWSGCWHNWEFVREIPVVQWCEYNRKDMPAGAVRKYVCNKCGRTKKHGY